MSKVEAVGGVATVRVEQTSAEQFQFSVEPASASGTGTVTAMARHTTGFGPLFDSAGAALQVDLSETSSFVVSGSILQLKVTSDNSADTFNLAAFPLST